MITENPKGLASIIPLGSYGVLAQGSIYSIFEAQWHADYDRLLHECSHIARVSTDQLDTFIRTQVATTRIDMLVLMARAVREALASARLVMQAGEFIQLPEPEPLTLDNFADFAKRFEIKRQPDLSRLNRISSQRTKP